MIKLKDILTESWKDAFKDNLFSVPLNKETEKYIQHVGDWVLLNNKFKGLNKYLPFKIMHVQKIHNGNYAYRVENQIDIHGFPLEPEYVLKYIDESEAAIVWQKNYLTYVHELCKIVPWDREFVPFEPKW